MRGSDEYRSTPRLLLSVIPPILGPMAAGGLLAGGASALLGDFSLNWLMVGLSAGAAAAIVRLARREPRAPEDPKIPMPSALLFCLASASYWASRELTSWPRWTLVAVAIVSYGAMIWCWLRIEKPRMDAEMEEMRALLARAEQIEREHRRTEKPDA